MSEPGFVGLGDYQDYCLPRRRRLFARRAPLKIFLDLLVVDKWVDKMMNLSHYV
jgi:hypothetical protein